MCESIEKEFEKLVLSQEEKKYVNKSDIYQIKRPFPGRGYQLWKKTDCARFYGTHRYNGPILIYLQQTPTIPTNYKNYHQLIDNISQDSFLENYQ